MAEEKKKSCLPMFVWVGFGVVGLLLVILFAMGTIGDLGVWEEFWDLIEKK